MASNLLDGNANRISVSGSLPVAAAPQLSSPSLRLQWQGEIDADTIVRVAGTRAVVTRLQQGEREGGRQTLLGLALYRQGVCIQLGDHDATRKSTALWYPLVEVNSEYGSVPAWALLVSLGSRWYVEIWL